MNENRFKIPPVLLLIGVWALATILRFYQLGEESLTFDEFYSLTLAAKSSFGEITRLTSADTHPPLYFWLLKLWCSLFSVSVYSIRAFSALLSSLTVPIVWLFARRVAGAGPALIACLLVALSPFHQWHGQDARMYPLLVFLEGAMLAAFAFLQEAHNARSRIVYAALVFLATALAALTHLFSLFIIAGVGLFWCLTFLNPARRRKEHLVPFALWSVGTAVFVAYGIYRATRGLKTGSIDWIPPLSLDTFHGLLNSFCYGVYLLPTPVWIIVPLFAAFLIAVIAGTWNSCAPLLTRSDAADNSIFCAFPGVLFLCTFLLPIAVSVFHPIVEHGQRYHIIATIPYYVLCAIGLRHVRVKFGLIAPAVLLLIMAAGMIRYHVDYFDSRQKRPYDTVAKFLDTQFHDGDAIVVEPAYTMPVIGHYLHTSYLLLPDGDPENLKKFRPKGIVWFLSFNDALTDFEKTSMAGGVRLYTNRYELFDMPALILRLTPYQLP